MINGIVLRIALGIFCWLGCTTATAQQDYPSKPIMVIVPSSPGSVTDVEGRIHLSKLSEYLHQSVVIDYKAGGSNMIGAAYVARAAPDGYTFLLTSASFSMFPLIEVDVPFDRVNAFAPVSLMSKRWTVMAVHPSLPSNVADFVAYAKANPGVINFGTSGAGKLQHLTGAWMGSLAGINMTFIHYKGGAQAHNDLIAGHIHVAPMALTTALPFMKSGRIKVLGMANLTRNPALPDIPTLHEQGLKDFEHVSWLGLAAPAKTPADRVIRVSSELAKVVKSPDVVKRLAGETQLVGSTPEEFRRTINAETERWRQLLKQQNIKLEMD